MRDILGKEKRSVEILTVILISQPFYWSWYRPPVATLKPAKVLQLIFKTSPGASTQKTTVPGQEAIPHKISNNRSQSEVRAKGNCVFPSFYTGSQEE